MGGSRKSLSAMGGKVEGMGRLCELKGEISVVWYSKRRVKRGPLDGLHVGARMQGVMMILRKVVKSSY